MINTTIRYKVLAMTDVATTLNNLQNKFNADAAQGMDEVFQFCISDDNDYFIEIKDGACIIETGEHDDPSVTLKMNKDTLKGLLSGEVNGMTAFMTGKVKAEGNMMLATKLNSLFDM